MLAEGNIGRNSEVEPSSDSRVLLAVEQFGYSCCEEILLFLPKPLFVFTELHAENLKNEDDVDTGLLGMN